MQATIKMTKVTRTSLWYQWIKFLHFTSTLRSKKWLERRKKLMLSIIRKHSSIIRDVFYPPRNHLVVSLSISLAYCRILFLIPSSNKQSDRHRWGYLCHLHSDEASLQRKKSVEFCAIIECLQFLSAMRKKNVFQLPPSCEEENPSALIGMMEEIIRNHHRFAVIGCAWNKPRPQLHHLSCRSWFMTLGCVASERASAAAKEGRRQSEKINRRGPSSIG